MAFPGQPPPEPEIPGLSYQEYTALRVGRRKVVGKNYGKSAKDNYRVDADERNAARAAQYKRNLKDSDWLLAQKDKYAAKNVGDESGYITIEDQFGNPTRKVKLQRTDVNQQYRVNDGDNGDQMRVENPDWTRMSAGERQMDSYSENPTQQYTYSRYIPKYKYSVKDADASWDAYSKSVNSSAYRNRVKVSSGKGSRGTNTAGASTFIVGERSALGEGGKQAARTATLTTSGASSKNAKAAAATKRKLR